MRVQPAASPFLFPCAGPRTLSAGNLAINASFSPPPAEASVLVTSSADNGVEVPTPVEPLGKMMSNSSSQRVHIKIQCPCGRNRQLRYSKAFLFPHAGQMDSRLVIRKLTNIPALDNSIITHSVFHTTHSSLRSLVSPPSLPISSCLPLTELFPLTTP